MHAKVRRQTDQIMWKALTVVETHFEVIFKKSELKFMKFISILSEVKSAEKFRALSHLMTSKNTQKCVKFIKDFNRKHIQLGSAISERFSGSWTKWFETQMNSINFQNFEWDFDPHRDHRVFVLEFVLHKSWTESSILLPQCVQIESKKEWLYPQTVIIEL